MKEQTQKYIGDFLEKYPQMNYLHTKIVRAIEEIASVTLPNKIMVCGNGGSFADSSHIVGELMKSFMFKRKNSIPVEVDKEAAHNLEEAIPAVCLGEMSALATAIANDIGAEWVYAQQVYGLGHPGDVLIGISTSGNAENVIRALRVAKYKNIFTIGLTGRSGGKMGTECDLLLNVPETQTYLVQELHLPLYHLLCACAEAERW